MHSLLLSHISASSHFSVPILTFRFFLYLQNISLWVSHHVSLFQFRLPDISALCECNKLLRLLEQVLQSLNHELLNRPQTQLKTQMVETDLFFVSLLITWTDWNPRASAERNTADMLPRSSNPSTTIETEYVRCATTSSILCLRPSTRKGDNIESTSELVNVLSSLSLKVSS